MSGPLAGKSILVTRPKHQADSAIHELEELGAIVFSMPAIEIRPPESYDALDKAICALNRYDWVVLTSLNGVRALAARIQDLQVPYSYLTERSLAAIGPATAAEMERLFRAPDVVPQDYVSEAIAEALPDVRGLRFLLARADIARRDLAHILRDRGAIVDEVTAYRIVPAEGSINLPSSAPDFITLTSAASARAAFEQLKSKGFEQWMRESSLVTIGPITSAAVRELGLTVAIEADEFTVPGMIAAIVERTEGQAVHA